VLLLLLLPPAVQFLKLVQLTTPGSVHSLWKLQATRAAFNHCDYYHDLLTLAREISTNASREKLEGGCFTPYRTDGKIYI